MDTRLTKGEYTFGSEYGYEFSVTAEKVEQKNNWLFLAERGGKVYSVNMDKIAVFTFEKNKND